MIAELYFKSALAVVAFMGISTSSEGSPAQQTDPQVVMPRP